MWFGRAGQVVALIFRDATVYDGNDDCADAHMIIMVMALSMMIDSQRWLARRPTGEHAKERANTART